MQRLLHSVLIFTLFAVATCGAVHAGMPMEELPASNCPYHEQQDAPQESDPCDSCLAPHFVGKSKVFPELGFVAVPALPQGSVVLGLVSIARQAIPAQQPDEDLHLQHHPIRI
jgi:hypothetical protein